MDNWIKIDLTTWTRLAEVDAYAERLDIDRETAIKTLVNAGLSYLKPRPG